MLVRNVNVSFLVLLMLRAGVPGNPPYTFVDNLTTDAPPLQSSPAICGRIPMNVGHRSALGASRKYTRPHLDKNVNELPHLNEPVSDEPDIDTYVGDEPRLYTNIRHEQTDQHVSDEPETDQHVSDEPETDQHVSDEPETDQHVSDEPEKDQYDIEEPDLDKIVGGRYARFGEVPWQANIMIWGYYNVTCSGAIISEFWVLTVVNCIRNRNPILYHVIVGDYSRSRREHYERTHIVDKIITHASFGRYKRLSQSFINDIALLRIKPYSKGGRGIIFGDYVQPVCLPYSGMVPRKGDKVIVSGWGRTQDGGKMSDILKIIDSEVISTMSCYWYFSMVPGTVTICVNHGANPLALGDHGDPAVYNYNGVHYLYGIASHFRGSAGHFWPTVFTSVSSYVGWINDNIKLNSDNVDQQRLPVPPQSV